MAQRTLDEIMAYANRDSANVAYKLLGKEVKQLSEEEVSKAEKSLRESMPEQWRSDDLSIGDLLNPNTSGMAIRLAYANFRKGQSAKPVLVYGYSPKNKDIGVMVFGSRSDYIYSRKKLAEIFTGTIVVMDLASPEFELESPEKLRCG